MKFPTHTSRMEQFCKAGLYLVTSQVMSGGRSTIEVIDAALRGGVRLIQLREKALSDEDLLKLAEAVRELTDRFDALLIINDRLDIAEKTGADGVHLGQQDMSVTEARRRAPEMIIGASSHSREEAVRAEAEGASYVNIGPIFPTKTKDWQDEYLGLESIRPISAGISIPWTVMGGIKKHHIPALVAEGARTIAVVTAVTLAGDVTAETAELLGAVMSGRGGK